LALSRLFAAGTADNNVEMLTALDEYGEINSASRPFVSARCRTVEHRGAGVCASSAKHRET
jgi:hypothetical protein